MSLFFGEVKLSTGLVLSMLTRTVSGVLLPALSRPVPVTVSPRPSVVSVTDGEQLLTRLPPVSSQRNVTVTLLLFQPFALGAGVSVALMVGATVSVVTVFWMVDVPPAFVPTMVSVCAPSGPRSKFAMENAPAATTACCPLTVTDVALPALPEILTIRVLINEPGRGELNVRVGGRTVITVTFAVAVFPATSVASAVIGAGEGPVGRTVVCPPPTSASLAPRPLTRNGPT